MKSVTIQRLETDDNGTFGVLTVDGHTEPLCMTAELPWRDNKRGVSCIPAGTYTCAWKRSPRLSEKYGFDTFKYEITNVPGRDGVLFHSGNFVGSEDAGLESQIKGCVLLGKQIGKMANAHGALQKAILQSRDAVKEFEAAMAQEPFKLTILDVPAVDYSKVGS